MTGGILQIVAFGAEDIYLSSDPNITFFKMVYRRHTNFSKNELDLNFNNKLTFGKEGYCKISHYGDIVHRLFLSIKLPKIDIYYDKQTVEEVRSLLSSHGINWNVPIDIPLTTQYNAALNTSVQKLINLKIVSLNEELSIIDLILNTLSTDGMFNAQIWKNNNPNVLEPQIYLNELISNYFQYDKYNIIYQIVQALSKDTENRPLLLANSQQIQQNIFNELLNNVTSEDFNPFTYNDANIQFLYYITATNYNVYNSVTSTTLFNTSIDNVYKNLPTSITYKTLDSYKIFNYALTQTEKIIDINTNTLQLQTQTLLYNNIFYGLQANIILLNNIYDTLSNNNAFIFYKKFIYINTNSYNKNLLFINQSQVITPDTLLDIITQNLYLLPTDITPPKILYNYLSDNIITSIKQFQNSNTNSFRDNNFNQYFNDFNLWQKTLINNQNENLNILFLNNIWIAMNDDIPKALIEYVSNILNLNLNPNSNPNPNLITFINSLNSIHNIIYEIIYPKIVNSMNLQVILDLNKLKNANDFIITAVFRPDQTSLVQNVTIPEYIINSYIDIVNSFADVFDNEIIMGNLIGIIMSFISDSIPLYSKNLNYKYVNIQSSIVNNLFLSVVKNYNNLFNLSMLNYNNFKDNIGSEALQLLIDISKLYINYDITPKSTHDYFRNNEQFQQNIPRIRTYLIDNLNILKIQLGYFVNNKTLLNMKNIIVPKSQYYYQQYLTVLHFIINIIKSNPTLYPYTTYNQSNDIVDITNNKLSDTSQEYIYPRNNAFDIINKIKLTVVTFLTQFENGFPYQSYLYNLWNLEYLNLNIQNELEQFDRLFGWLYNNVYNNNVYNNVYNNDGSSELYKFYQQINSIYDNFQLENDVYNFIKDYIIQKSFLKDVPKLISTDINGTYINILDYFVTLRKTNRSFYDKIHGSTDTVTVSETVTVTPNNVISLSETLNLAVGSNTIRANFAWIKKLGHYIVNNVSLKFDDQTITTLYGEWIEIWYSLTKDINREIGYNKLIGNISELYTFNNRQKKSYELLIPLPFWFCRNVGVSLPLVAMNNVEIKIYVKLREFNEVAYYDQFTKFARPPKLTCKMIAEYIYVENNERDKLARSKLQYQVDILQYNGDLIVTKDCFPSSSILQSIIRFFGPCKELFWVLQDISYINGTLPNGERTWDRYDYPGSVDTTKFINPIMQSSIQFNGRDREKFKDSIFYNYIQPYERHLADPSLGVNIYSFSLDPTSVQSMGTANLSKIDDASISITLMPNVMADLNDNKVIFRLGIYAMSINMLRVCSGLAGLMYYM
jgi:hypothetical protein